MSALLNAMADVTRRQFAGAIEAGRKRADQQFEKAVAKGQAASGIFPCLYCSLPTENPDSYCTKECAARAESDR